MRENDVNKLKYGRAGKNGGIIMLICDSSLRNINIFVPEKSKEIRIEMWEGIK